MPRNIDTPLPHRPSALQRTLGASAVLHFVLVVALAWAAPTATARSWGVAEAPAEPPAPIEVEPSESPQDEAVPSAPSVDEGREDLAQGEPVAPVAPAPVLAEPPDPPRAAPPPAPRPAPAPATPPHAPDDATPAQPDPPTPATSAPTPATPAPRGSTGAAGAPAVADGPKAPTPGPPADPGEGGGFARAKARDLAASFTRELPPACDAMAAWRTLPEGDAGVAEIELRTDAEGRLQGEASLTPADAAPHLAEIARRTKARLGRGPSALDRGGPGAGVLRLRIAARIERVPVPEGGDGVPFGLRAEFRDGRGEATFTLPEGRRITVVVTVVRAERDPG